MALRQAEVEPTIMKNKTGVPDFEDRLSQRLQEIGEQAGPNFVPQIEE
jgi:hypothetical protein